MIERLRNAMQRRAKERSAQILRPNQLQQDAVRAERLRREALRPRLDRAEARRPREEHQEQNERRGRPESRITPPLSPRADPWHVKALASRSSLRRAWLLTEILGPPRALRERPDDTFPA